MKKTFCILGSIALLCVGFVLGKKDIDDPVQEFFLGPQGKIEGPPRTRSTYVEDKKSLFQELGPKKCDVLFVGDSLNDNALWQELLSPRCVANRSIQGITTRDVIEMLPLLDLVTAPYVVLMVGRNDIARDGDVEAIGRNYVKIVDHFLEKNVKIILTSVLNTHGKRVSLNPKIDQLNRVLEEKALDHDKVRYLDLNRALSPKGRLLEKYSEDGIHLRGSGYTIWRDLLIAHLNGV